MVETRRFGPEHGDADQVSVVAGRSVEVRRPPFIARVVAWLIVPVYIAGTGANFWLEGFLGPQEGRVWEDTLLLVGFGAFAVVGALLVAKRPANVVGWIMATVGMMVGVFPAGDTYAAYVMTTFGHPDALAVFGAWTQGWYWFLLLALVLIYLPLYFPDGRLPSRRWLPFALLMGILMLSIVVLGALTDTLRGQDVDYRIENPIGIEGLAPVESLPIFSLLGVLLGVGCVGAAVAVVVRFRRARGIERQQMKWFLYATALIPVFPLLNRLPEIVDAILFNLLIVALPTAIGIAVLRYRLYDIDLVINRTLVYTALTASLVMIYLGGVVSLQYMFRAVTGSESQLAVRRNGIQKDSQDYIFSTQLPLPEAIEQYLLRLISPSDKCSRLGSCVAPMVQLSDEGI